ncbi:MAG: altronate dehydratase [Ruminococcaceae bacterium]|nr:altronate dehydratase [Oscillospiraceae bacterium]
MNRLIIDSIDNVEINLEDGHKYARRDISKGEDIIKYGFPIGHATCDIKKGDHVHTHNVKTNLSDHISYEFSGDFPYEITDKSGKTFMGYLRENGDIGIRNDIWIVNTVGCVNKTAEILSKQTGAKNFPHPFGCSQLGEDFDTTRIILKSMVNHPNAGGVLVLGLGCENNYIDSFKEFLGNYNENRVKFLNCQDSDDEIADGIKLINELKEHAATYTRQEFPISKLKIGLKCGGSDGFSGLTANPLVGRVCDKLTAAGATCVMTEVPEMFGAEHLLMKRAINEEVFGKIVNLINNFKDYYVRHDQVIYENPSPGNKKGGITTLEEKSLGCIKKGGFSAVTDVLDIGDDVKKSGLNLLNGPGNDLVAITNLMASKVHIILFTTGRGTPAGSAVPTVKISTNNNLFNKKNNWIDFDASPIINGKDADVLADELVSRIVDFANGEKAKNEIYGYEEISIFKDGVTL